jgi:amino acid transporter
MSERVSQAPAGAGEVAAEASGTAAPAMGGLRGNVLGLPHAVVISVAVMSPAASIFYNTIPQAGAAGAAIPLCFAIGFVVALLVANQYSELSRELPSSGSAYTFVTVGLGRRWGFMVAWIGVLALALGVPYSFVLMSASLETLINRWAGINLPWPAYFVVATALVFALCYWGIRQSLRIDLTFLAVEFAACLAFAGVVLFHVGSGSGLSALPFTPAGVPVTGDLTTGIVFAVLSFIGFETAATLGEETRNPRRNIPWAVYGSMIVVGLFYVLLAYALTMGYGMSKMATGYANDPAPFDTIARNFGGSSFVALVDLVAVASFFSAAVAIVNGGARMLFAASRDGALPRWLAWTHPRRQTPAAAVAALCLVGLVPGIVLGLVLQPINAFGFFGFLDAFLVLLIYALVSAACFFFFWRQRRARFNVLRHGVVPALGLLISLGIVAATAAQPGAAPLNWVPIVGGVWVALGIVALLVTKGKLGDAPTRPIEP